MSEEKGSYNGTGPVTAEVLPRESVTNYRMVAPDQHIFHHSDGPKINVKAERNTKGFNYEATVSGANTVDEALALLGEAIDKLKAKYEAAA